MFVRYLLFWLSISSGIALLWPRLSLGFDPFLASKPFLNYLIAATMFAVGVMMPQDEIRQVIRRWPAVLYGTAIQYCAMPFLAWTVARLWPMSPEHQIGVIMVGCVPGAMASNVLTMNARGHTSYSVSLTTSATLLSPLVVPLVLRLTLGARADVPMGLTSLMLLFTVVLPVVTGYALVRVFPKLEAIGLRLGPVIANGCIIWIISVVVALNRNSFLGSVGNIVAALAVVNILGYLAGYGAATAAKLPESMRRALTLEVGMQNAGLGTAMVQQLFPDDPGAMIPTALYTFGCVLTASILAYYWSCGATNEAHGEMER